MKWRRSSHLDDSILSEVTLRNKCVTERSIANWLLSNVDAADWKLAGMSLLAVAYTSYY